MNYFMANTKKKATQAKSKKAFKKKEVKTEYKSQPMVDDDVITIEVQAFFTPVTILIGAMMISMAILYGLKDINVNSTDNNTDTVTDTSKEVAIDDSVQAPLDTDANGLAYYSANIDDDAIKGNRETAKVAIIEFSDYECPYCQDFATKVYGELVKNYVDTGEVIIVFRDLPWLEAHPNSEIAANAANCAREQKGDTGYYDFHDKLLSRDLEGVDSLYAIAKELKLDESQFKTCVDSEKYMDEVFADRDYAHSIGIGGTPGFVIGLIDEDGNVDGVNIGGLAAYSTYANVIDSYLAKAK